MAPKERPMAKMRVRGDKLTVTIPEAIRDEIAALDGDEIDVSAEGDRIVLTPKDDLAEGHPEIDAALAEALEDERAGRISPAFDTMEELEAWFKTPDGKKFRRK